MGEIKSVNQLQITTSDGKQTPSQLRALAWWPDKSIRWVLCDFQADVKPGDSTHYYLVSEPTGNINSPLDVQETGQIVTIDTGKMKFSVSKSRQTFVEDVILAGKPLVAGSKPTNLGFLVSDTAGNTYESAADAPQSVVVEDREAFAFELLEFMGEGLDFFTNRL